jgi:hypothetical protein
VRAEIAREPGGPSPYDEGMAALRSLERHELLGLDPRPGRSPVFDPRYRLESLRRLMARYDIRPCER